MIEMGVMTLKIARSMTDQLQLGDSVVVLRTGIRPSCHARALFVKDSHSTR